MNTVLDQLQRQLMEGYLGVEGISKSLPLCKIPGLQVRKNHEKGQVQLTLSLTSRLLTVDRETLTATVRAW